MQSGYAQHTITRLVCLRDGHVRWFGTRARPAVTYRVHLVAWGQVDYHLHADKFNTRTLAPHCKVMRYFMVILQDPDRYLNLMLFIFYLQEVHKMNAFWGGHIYPNHVITTKQISIELYSKNYSIGSYREPVETRLHFPTLFSKPNFNIVVVFMLIPPM
jgi:hypothetical protein